MKVEVFRDFACAWSRLGTRRFELATAEAGLSGSVELVHRPFLLNPDIPADIPPGIEPLLLLDAMGARFGGRERAESMLSSKCRSACATESNTILIRCSRSAACTRTG